MTKTTTKTTQKDTSPHLHDIMYVILIQFNSFVFKCTQTHFMKVFNLLITFTECTLKQFKWINLKAKT